MRSPEIWRIAPAFLEQAQDDATLLAIRDMERAGIDIITDGEIRRESYSNRFATALEGIDIEHPGTTINRSGQPIPVPRIVGPIRRTGPVEITRRLLFLKKHTARKIKITLPGPFTMAQQAQDDHYGDEEAVAMAFAAAVNEEIRDLKAAGADVIQLDEPWLQARHERAARYGVKAINRALEGIAGTTVVHLCFGYAAAVKDKPSGYSFLPQLADTRADADLDRGGAAEARPRRAARAGAERSSCSACSTSATRKSRAPRSWPSASARAWRTSAPSGWWPRRTAG